MEMQLSGYHVYCGCCITIVDCAKEFLYSGSCARAVIWNYGDEFFFIIFGVYYISFVFSISDNHAMFGGILWI